jgi:hypothetical protein
VARKYEADDYEDDPVDPDESDMDDDDSDETDVATIQCPHCGADVYEFAERCPTCGRYISEEDAPPRSTHPRWVIATATVLLLIMLYALLKWWL